MSARCAEVFTPHTLSALQRRPHAGTCEQEIKDALSHACTHLSTAARKHAAEPHPPRRDYQVTVMHRQSSGYQRWRRQKASVHFLTSSYTPHRSKVTLLCVDRALTVRRCLTAGESLSFTECH